MTALAAVVVPVPVVVMMAVLVAFVVMVVPRPATAAVVFITLLNGTSFSGFDVTLLDFSSEGSTFDIAGVETTGNCEAALAAVMVPVPVVVPVAVLVASMMMVVPGPPTGAVVSITLLNGSSFSRFDITLLNIDNIVFNIARVMASMVATLAAAIMPVPVVAIVAVFVAVMVMIVPGPTMGAVMLVTAFFKVGITLFDASSSDSIVLDIALVVTTMFTAALAATVIPVPVIAVVAMPVALMVMTVPVVAVMAVWPAFPMLVVPVISIIAVMPAGVDIGGSLDSRFRCRCSADESQQTCCGRKNRSNMHW
jgi:hypothetical protein